MKNELLSAILKELETAIEKAENTLIEEEEEDTPLGARSSLELRDTLDDLFQELIEYARDEEEYELVSALEGIYSLWHTEH